MCLIRCVGLGGIFKTASQTFTRRRFRFSHDDWRRADHLITPFVTSAKDFQNGAHS
jgi:hypothetical protein